MELSGLEITFKILHIKMHPVNGTASAKGVSERQGKSTFCSFNTPSTYFCLVFTH
jgi:hypothetical protein